MKHGFGTILAILIAGVALATAGFVAREVSQARLGGTVTYTQLSDTISTFLSNVSSSFTSVNTHLNTISSTVGTYGNITSYSVPLHATGGGTGTTTAPSSFLQYLGYNGAGWAPLSFVAGSGMTLTSSTTSTVLSTQGLDTAANYNWSGTHNFSSTVRFQSTTLFTNVSSFNVSSTAQFDGSVTSNATHTFRGNVVGGPYFYTGLIAASTTDVSAGPNVTTTVFSVNIPANTLLKNGSYIEFWADMSVTINTSNETTTVTLTYGSSTLSSFVWTDWVSGNGPVGWFHGFIYSAGASSQESVLHIVTPNNATSVSLNNIGTASEDAATDRLLVFAVKPRQTTVQTILFGRWFVRIIQ